jgi:hypothetical protein
MNNNITELLSLLIKNKSTKIFKTDNLNCFINNNFSIGIVYLWLLALPRLIN